jgi:hypothetical protein
VFLTNLKRRATRLPIRPITPPVPDNTQLRPAA